MLVTGNVRSESSAGGKCHYALIAARNQACMHAWKRYSDGARSTKRPFACLPLIYLPERLRHESWIRTSNMYYNAVAACIIYTSGPVYRHVRPQKPSSYVSYSPVTCAVAAYICVRCCMHGRHFRRLTGPASFLMTYHSLWLSRLLDRS